jgi:NAD(P) transhydrogenase subunit alpha
MQVGVPRERAEGERRVALVPESVKRLAASGTAVVVERGAGEGSFVSDEQYAAAGATLGGADDALGADVVVKVARPTEAEVAKLKPGAVLITTLQPLVNHDLVRALAERKVTSLSMDAIPRVTRAQPMDSLSSQSNIAGYKAVLNAAAALPRFFPMLTTAAGTVTPARVFVIGAGVAGLQAIATARRLGAVVEAFDTRPVVKEQVQSLGAKFIEIDLGASGEGSGGYARELTPEEQQKQRELMAERVAAADVVITTALVPGRRAPVLITADAARSMRPGSVIVDLAAEMGGNCELTKPGEVVVVNGVRIDGTLNLPSTVAAHASQLYSRNVSSLLGLVLKDGKLALDLGDEITKGAVITHEGEVVHGPTKAAMSGAKA